jgi:hypothetical protein
MDELRRYRYVGPAEIRDRATAVTSGAAVRTAADFARWIADTAAHELAEPFTYVVDVEGTLRLAPRRSEHIACAGGDDVLAAGEIVFERSGEEWLVSHVSNQSTGYCPDVTCWPVVALALDRAELRRPASFTTPFVFRVCVYCLAINIVKDDDYTCCVCTESLPERWNVADFYADRDQANVESM